MTINDRSNVARILANTRHEVSKVAPILANTKLEVSKVAPILANTKLTVSKVDRTLANTQPLSYTHLRFHDTWQNILYRLLLVNISKTKIEATIAYHATRTNTPSRYSHAL